MSLELLNEARLCGVSVTRALILGGSFDELVFMNFCKINKQNPTFSVFSSITVISFEELFPSGKTGVLNIKPVTWDLFL